MGDVSKGEGRTVLFVSHNIGAVQALCNNAILLDQGSVLMYDKTNLVVNKYISLAQSKNRLNKNWENRKGNRKIEFVEIGLYDSLGLEKFEFFMGDDINIKLKVKFNEAVNFAEIGINIRNSYDELFTHITNFDDEFKINGSENEIVEYTIRLKDIYFTPGGYYLDASLVSGSDCFDQIVNCTHFDMIEGEKIKRGSFPGHIKVYTPSAWGKLK